MSRVKGRGPLLTAKFNGRGKKNIPDTQATKSLVLLSIVGNEYCAGDYLKSSTIQASNEFDFTTYLIADEVYWHNLKPEDTLNDKQVHELKEHACRLGEDYFNANRDAFLAPFSLDTRNKLIVDLADKNVDDQINLINNAAKTLPKPFEIVRWNTWVNTPRSGEKFTYTQLKTQIENCFNEVDALKASIEKTASNFAARHKDNGSEDLWLNRSRGYLKEESPAVMWLGAKREYNFIVYPGDMIAPFQATKDFFVIKHEEQSPVTAPPPLLIPVENSDQLLNWLQPFFTRSSAKVSELAAPNLSTTPSETQHSSMVQTLITGESNLIPRPPSPHQANPSGFFASRVNTVSPEEQTQMQLVRVVSSSTEGILKHDSEISPDIFDKTMKAMSDLLTALTPDERLQTISLLFTKVQEMNTAKAEDLEVEKGSSTRNGTIKSCK